MSLVFQEVDANRRRRRVLQFSAIVILAFGGLFFRLGSLQLTHVSSLTDQSVSNYVRREQLPAKRGSILDRKGRPLAIHKPTYRLSLDPRKLGSPAETIQALRTNIDLQEAKALKIEDELRQRKESRSRKKESESK